METVFMVCSYLKPYIYFLIHSCLRSHHGIVANKNIAALFSREGKKTTMQLEVYVSLTVSHCAASKWVCQQYVNGSVRP